MSVSAEDLQAVVSSSEVMVTWALAIAAGSVAAIVSTSYFRPENRLSRLIYLLFIPGWMLLGHSIYFGNSVTRNGLAAHFVNESMLPQIGAAMNTTYLKQQTSLTLALGVFAVWLLIYLFWWIWASQSGTKQQEKP